MAGQSLFSEILAQKGLTVKMNRSQEGQREPRKRWRPALGFCLPVVSHQKACLGSVPTARSLLFSLPDTAWLPVSSAPLLPSDLSTNYTLREAFLRSIARASHGPLYFPFLLLYTLTQPLMNSRISAMRMHAPTGKATCAFPHAPPAHHTRTSVEKALSGHSQVN